MTDTSTEAVERCKHCKNKGWVRYEYPSTKPIPAYWFNRGAVECDQCETLEPGDSKK